MTEPLSPADLAAIDDENTAAAVMQDKTRRLRARRDIPALGD